MAEINVPKSDINTKGFMTTEFVGAFGGYGALAYWVLTADDIKNAQHVSEILAYGAFIAATLIVARTALKIVKAVYGDRPETEG